MDVKDRLSAALAGRYEIAEEIGRGGMAVVYLARDLRLERRVAIKVLRPEFSASLVADRFVQEIQIAARLEHPLILPLHESDSSDGLLWYAMPYIQGPTLQRRLDHENQLPVDEAVAITCEVAEALSYAHRQGVIHRDIKPANVLFSEAHPRVADFGIAKAFTEAGGAVRTATAVGIGTPGYMSPEQATGEKNVDHRTDIYSLGCVLYEMLAGETPYTGPTAQSIIAKQLSLPVPSICTVRDTVPPALDDVLQRALAKVPADRFATAPEFADALTDAVSTAIAWKRKRRTRVLGLTALAAATLVLVALGIVRATAGARARPLDANKVVVFPLVVADQVPADPTTGWSVALAIGGALEHAHPLKFLDGWRWLPERMRSDPRLVTPAIQESISREQGARYYADGVLRADNGSRSVLLRLQDVRGDSLVAQETATGPTHGAGAQILGIQAFAQLLPRLVEPGRKVDLSPYSDRKPGAILLSIQGDREYRHSRFGTALEFYRRAVAEDSLMAFAAAKGAQAASWENRYDEAKDLITVARTHKALLPAKYQHYVDGWHAYLTGRADSALVSLSAALRIDADWSEASTALGEVYYHLLPTAHPLDTLARAAFEASARSDPQFITPMLHLGEIAARAGDLVRAGLMLQRLVSARADSSWITHLAAMVDCVEAGSKRYSWRSLADADPSTAVTAARALAMGGAQMRCAERGFREVLSAREASSGNRWGSLMGLQGVLLAQRRHAEALALLDSAQAAGSRGVFSLYVFGAIAGAPFEHKAVEAEQIARAATGPFYSRANLATRWLLGVWAARRGDEPTVRGIVRELRQANQPAVSRVAGFLEAHLAAARGDTDDAIARLEGLETVVPPGDITWDITGPLAPERALLADLLLAKGEFERAARVASTFDQPGVVVFLPYLPRSLMVRLRTARALGRSAAVAALSDRVKRLGWADSAAVAVNH